MPSPPSSPSAPQPTRVSTQSLQRKTSFISTLRTLPTQRQSILLGQPVESGSPLIGIQNNPPLGAAGPSASAVFSDDAAPASIRGPQSSVAFGDEECLPPVSKPASSSRRGASVAAGSDDQAQRTSSSRRNVGPGTPGATEMSRQSTEGSPTSVVGKGARTPPFPVEQAAGPPSPSCPPRSWLDVFTVLSNLPPEVAARYDALFNENEMPAPDRADVLLFGVDHEVLQCIGIRSAGHRSSIIAACRSLGYQMRAHQLRHQTRGGLSVACSGPDSASGFDNDAHHVHFMAPAPTSADGHSKQPEHSQHARTSSEESRSSEMVTEQRCLPRIYRAMGNHGSAVFGDEACDEDPINVFSGFGDEVESVVGSTSKFGDDEGRHPPSHHSGSRIGHHHHSETESLLKAPLLDGAVSVNTDALGGGCPLPRERQNTLTRSGSARSAVLAYREGIHQPHADSDVSFVYDDTTVHQFEFRSCGKHPYVWVDLVGRDPRRHAFRDHLRNIATVYEFDESLLLDIDLTLALPQVISCPNEPDQFLVILRVASASSGGIEEDSLHLLTNRVMLAVNLKNRTVVSVHRRDTNHLAQLREAWLGTHSDKSMSVLMCQMLEDSLLSYVDAIHDSESLLDEYEALMLRHSVGGTGSNATTSTKQRFFNNNGSFTDDHIEKRSWWSELLKVLGFGDGASATTRHRSATTMSASPTMDHSVAMGGLRLRNKEYQEDMLESDSFSRQRMNQLLYHLHRRCSVYNRMLTLTQTTLEVSYTTLHLASPEYAEQVGRSCGELAMKAETLHDNCQNLLNLHLSLVSFRTNELMNLLTVYSAVFIPITFVCSVYGMNFINMPELGYENGYFICLGVMGLMVAVVLLWFHKKGFL